VFMEALDDKSRALFSLLIVHGRHVVGRLPPWHRSDDPFDWLIAELLLRRTTRTAAEKAFNQVTAKWKTWKEFAETDREEIYNEVSWLGLGNQRSKHLSELSTEIVQSYDGSTPRSRVELQKLPGVGRYAAEAVRLYAFGEPTFPVDSGVQRVLRRAHGLPIGSKSEHSRPNEDPYAQEIVDEFTTIGSPPELKAAHRGVLSISWSFCKKEVPECTWCPLQTRCVSSETTGK